VAKQLDVGQVTLQVAANNWIHPGAARIGAGRDTFNVYSSVEFKNKYVVTCHPRTISPTANDILMKFYLGRQLLRFIQVNE
jgi:hypothetical protein